MAAKSGAGLIPFAVRDGLVYFLFHRTFSGRRAGLLVDFGGRSRKGESLPQTAAREFVEETEAMFLCDDSSRQQDPREHVESQTRNMMALLGSTQAEHPDWWSQRCVEYDSGRRVWNAYFVEVEFRELDGMNSAWAEDTTGQFRKRRELLWVQSEQLLAIFADERHKLWKRLRQLGSARTVIQSIIRHKETATRQLLTGQ